MMLSAVWFGLSVLACCSLAGTMGRALGVIDYPDGGRKSHARPTPMVGGIALMVPLLLVALVEANRSAADLQIFTMLLLIGAGFLLLGLHDDRHHIQPGLRLLVSAALFGSVVLLEPSLALVALDLSGPVVIPLGALAFPFTILCLVGLQNAINMADGMNGLLIGLSMFWAACLLAYAPDFLSPYLALMLLGLAILLLYNLAGALFLGDAGSYAIGGTIGILMIYVYQSAGGTLPMLTVVLWLFVPVIDCLRVMVIRALQRRSPFRPDKNHLHHRLARHWRWPVCLVIYLALVVIPGSIGVLAPDLSLAMIVLSLSCYGGLLLITRNRLSHSFGPSRADRRPPAPRGPAQAVDSPRGST
ncbi:MAG TPA: MraY family glycosyltransferase [Geminicoccaceae bacterium]|nr:MraY family glycosyltransferase [Geminicoccaceae bacterium]